MQAAPGKMLVSVVEEVDEISEEDAKHIQMFFGCAKCKRSFSDAKEVLLHVRSGECPGTADSTVMMLHDLIDWNSYMMNLYCKYCVMLLSYYLLQ